MGFFTDVGICWAVGSIFWLLLRIFAYAYITLWRFFGTVFTIRGTLHYHISKLLFSIFRVPHKSQNDRVESKVSVKRVSIVTQSPVRAFLFTFAPLLIGTMLVYVIRVYLGNETQERLIVQIVVICILLIIIVPSITEMKFVVRSFFHHPLRTIREGLITFLVIVMYVWEIDWISQLPIYGTYLFEFGLLVSGFFLVELIIGTVKYLGKWLYHRISDSHQVRPKPFHTPKAVIKAREETMYPHRRANRKKNRVESTQEIDPT